MSCILIKQTVIFSKKQFEHKQTNDKKNRKVKDHCDDTGKYRGDVNSICNLKYSAHQELLVDFQNRSHYDDHFMIKELAEEF